ncbi:hypothetical protein ABG067_003660 [Albugo candida]
MTRLSGGKVQKQTFVSLNAKQISRSLQDYRKEKILDAMVALKATPEKQEAADNPSGFNEGENIGATAHSSKDIDDQDVDSEHSNYMEDEGMIELKDEVAQPSTFSDI